MSCQIKTTNHQNGESVIELVTCKIVTKMKCNQYADGIIK